MPVILKGDITITWLFHDVLLSITSDDMIFKRPG